MRLRRLQAQGFLSFDGFDLPLDDQITMVVGANGHGKSNLGHLLNLAQLAVTAADRTSPELDAVLDKYVAARRIGSGSGAVELRLDLELTGPAEQRLLLTYLQAAIAHALLGTTTGNDTTPIDSWLEAQVTARRVSALFTVTLIVNHAGLPDSRWQVSVEFEVPTQRRQNRRYRWLLSGWMQSDSLLGVEDVDRINVPGHSLADRLHGRTRAQGAHPVAPGGVFSLARLLPRTHRAVGCALDLGGTPSMHMRRFTELIDVDPRGYGDNVHHYGLSRVLRVLLEQTFSARTDARLVLPTRGVEVKQDPRAPQTLDLLAEQLFWLKNGPSSERPRYDRVVQRFSEYTNGRQIDITAQATTKERAPASGVHLQLMVSIQPIVNDHRGPVQQVPIEFAGSGAGEALMLAFALEASPDEIVFLDEPAATLHPSMQRAFTAHVSASAAQFIIVTHSPYLVPFTRRTAIALCRFELDDESRTRTWRLDPKLLAKVAPKVLAKGNQGLPFASRAVLCEGQSDVAFVHALAARLDLRLEEPLTSTSSIAEAARTSSPTSSSPAGSAWRTW